MATWISLLGEVYPYVRNDIFKWCRLWNFTPSWQQMQALGAIQRGDRFVAIRSGQGPGKCLPLTDTNSTMYNPAMGIRQSMSDAVAAGNLTVASMREDNERIETKPAVAFSSGSKPCVRIVADSGQEVDLSNDHPIYTPAGWKPAAEIKPGDLVAAPRWLPAPNKPLEISDEEVLVVAGLLCDGGTKDGADITHLPGRFLDLFLLCCDELNIGYAHDKQVSKALTYGLKRALPLIRKWGLYGKLSKEKRVPAEFYGLDDDKLGTFFNAIFACDGYITKDGYEITLASKDFITDIQTLLLRFGVHSRFRYKPAKCQTGTFDSWRLTISGKSNILALHNAMGLPLGKETQTLAMLNGLAEENTNTDVVPIKINEVDEMLNELGYTSTKGQPKDKSRTEIRNKYRGRSESYWSRQKLQNFCAEFDYKGKHAKRADNDIYWVKAKEIKDIGVHPVYDLTVEDNHNFVINNFVVHNTTVCFIIATWLAIQDEKAQIILTAPTMRQCRDGFLAEGRRLLPKADPLIQKLIDITLTKLMVCNDSDWGIKTVTATDPKAAQGMHEKNQWIICDEASGIPRPIIEQFQGTSSNPGCGFIQIGNPNLRDCAFFDCFYGDQAPNWTKIHWNAEQTPEHICSPERNWRIADQYGKESDVYRVRVLGEFPRTDPNSVISQEALEQFRDKSLMLPASRVYCDGRIAKQFGIDFARGGGDESTAYQRMGNAVLNWNFWTQTEPGDVADKVFQWQKDWSWSNDECLYVPDANGMGAGVLKQFYDKKKRTFEFMNHQTARDSLEYGNRITEAYFNIRKKTQTGDQMYLGENATKLIKQLSTRLYFVDKKGKIVLEDKPSYVKRIGESPDRADGFVQAFYDFAHAAGQVSSPMQGTKRLGESTQTARRQIGSMN